MQLILREDVPNLGHIGDVVTVKPGYGRNFLVPRGLAVIATAKNVRELEHQKRVIAAREQKLLQDAEATKAKLEGLSVNIAKRVGEEEKLYGSVTTKEIAEALAAQGIEIDRRKLQVHQPIRSLGVHSVVASLGRELKAEIKVWVVAK